VPGTVDELESSPADPQTAHCRRIASLTAVIGNGCARDLRCRIILIGSADKRPLSGKLTARFGSNEGLARARAE
jgi:hypothetical protein